MPKDTTRKPPGKARKPRNDFPLFVHQTRRWCKKVKGVHRYFGKVSDDPKGEVALDLWLATKDALLAGREPQLNPQGATIKQLVNGFLSHKQALRAAGEIADRTFQKYYATCVRLVKSFGRTCPVDDLVADDLLNWNR